MVTQSFPPIFHTQSDIRFNPKFDMRLNLRFIIRFNSKFKIRFNSSTPYIMFSSRSLNRTIPVIRFGLPIINQIFFWNKCISLFYALCLNYNPHNLYVLISINFYIVHYWAMKNNFLFQLSVILLLLIACYL